MRAEARKAKVCDSSFCISFKTLSVQDDVGNVYLRTPFHGWVVCSGKARRIPPLSLQSWKVVYCVVVTSFFFFLLESAVQCYHRESGPLPRVALFLSSFFHRPLLSSAIFCLPIRMVGTGVLYVAAPPSMKGASHALQCSAVLCSSSLRPPSP